MSNQEKLAANFRDALNTMGGQMGDAAVRGAGAAVVGAGLGMVGVAASKLYDAATKARDFKQMLMANPDLHEEHQANPRGFNQMFSSLRSMAPEFSKDPLVAGEYMRRMSSDPGRAGGYLIGAVSERPKNVEHPVLDSYMKGGLEGMKPHREGGGSKQGPSHGPSKFRGSP